jgi:hypothetical protein
LLLQSTRGRQRGRRREEGGREKEGREEEGREEFKTAERKEAERKGSRVGISLKAARAFTL